jgi:hypothetical protein
LLISAKYMRSGYVVWDTVWAMYGRISRVSREVTYTGSALLAGVPTRFTMAFLGCFSDAPDHSAHAGIPTEE